ncbi:hypothetical protein ACFYYB_07930 [Streptomyces sp. NPDC002886]|uniref:hypothetical protein n=1 Tax=Streptomyces sp. NPDC002886 TaxID=3364667 RepID=UPI0036876987
MALASRERQYLHQELTEEVSATYADILCDAWGLFLRSERDNKPAQHKTVRQTVAGMERAALLALKRAEYLEDDMAPEKRLKRDRERYEKAWRADQADIDTAL